MFAASRGLRLEDVLGFERIAFARDRSGAPPMAATSFAVAVDPERLFYVAACSQPPDHDATLTAGTFAAGLWRRDVAELFIRTAGSPAYVELNLSPGGAWWRCAFASYRQPDRRAAVPPSGVETLTDVGPASWIAGLAIDRAAVSPAGRLDHDTRLNVCAIIGGTRRQHLCWRAVPGEADFHDEACFVEVKKVAI